MRIRLKNIGKVAEAEIDISGVTVVAGDNGTGKSTVGRSLYSAYSSLFDSDIKIQRMRRESIRDKISLARRVASRELFGEDRHPINLSGITDAILNRSLGAEEVSALLRLSFGPDGSKAVDSALTGGIDVLAREVSEIVSISDEEAFSLISSRQFETEFNNQINSVSNDLPGFIELEIKRKSYRFDVAENKVVHSGDRAVLTSQIYYFDDSHSIDFLGVDKFMISRYKRQGHQGNLDMALYNAARKPDSGTIDDLIREKHLMKVMEMVNSVCPGSFIKDGDGRSFVYIEKGNRGGIQPGNLSDGLKTFAQIKLLLEKGSLSSNGTIILDEPENHLHPAWQLVFAELIVLLHKELGIHAMISTHSPYFLNAIEVYSKKHEIDEFCSYYLAEIGKDGSSIFSDITGSTEIAYGKLAAPFDTLEKEECGLE